MQELLTQLKAIWGDLPTNRKMLVGGSLAAVIVGFAVLLMSQSGTKWASLGRGLTPEDLDAAVKVLEAKKIEVRLADNDVLQVPAKDLYQARLAISAKGGGSTGGGVGMELFDEMRLGETQFKEKVNYHRAVEGELARTIRSLDVIMNARVHLVIPKNKMFRKDQKRPSAAVKIGLKTGVELGKDQILGIRNLVAGGIEGMKPDDVTIVDQYGRMLAYPGDQKNNLSGDLMEMQAKREMMLEEAVLEVLQPVVEGGRVRVQVTAEMDFSRSETTKKELNPENQVVSSENRSEETSTTAKNKPRGIAGAGGNLTQTAARDDGKGETSSSSKTESVQYENESTVKRTETPGGRVKRLTVAVVVGGRQEIDEETGKEKWVGLSEAQKSSIEELVASAAGLDTERGDKLTVASLPFANDVPGTESVAPEEISPWIRMAVQYGTMALLGLTFAFGVARPFVKAMAPPVSESTEIALSGESEVVPNGEAPVDGEAENLATAQLPEHTESGQVDETLALSEGTDLDSLAGLEGLDQLGGDEGIAGEEEMAEGDEIVEGRDRDEKVKSRGERLRVRAIEATHSDPEKAVEIIRTWLLVEDV